MIAQPVRVALEGEPASEAALFVPDVPRSARAQLLEDVADVLEEERDFLPVLFGGRHALVNRASIAYVAVARRPPGADDEVSDVHALFDHRCPVTIRLHGGTSLRGTLLFSSPADRARLVDFMNRGPRFIQVWTGDELILVQRSAIRTLIESVGEGGPEAA